MKQFSTLLLALGLSATCAMGQNVTVFMKDNTTHKFNAEYLSEIKFRDVTPSPDQIEFKTIELNPYSGGNVEITLTNEAGDVSCKADMYGSPDALYLQAGAYEVAGTSAPFTVNPTYSKVTMEGESYNITGGNVTVQIGNSQPASSILRTAGTDHTYIIHVNFTLEGGKTLVGEFTGELPSYTPWLDGVMSAAKYLENPQPRGQFYVKFNDADWKYDMALVFIAEEGDNTLPGGTYTLSDFATPGSILSASYVDGYGPNFNSSLLPGSKVTVEKTGEYFEMDMELNLSDGRTAHFTYAGEISGTPSFLDPTPEGIEYPELVLQPYGGGNTTLVFFSEGNKDQISLDCYGSDNASYFEPGIYVIGGTTPPYIDTNISYTYYCENYTAEEHDAPIGFKSGTLTVTRDGNVYTFALDAVLANDEPLQVWHKGTLDVFGPEINMEMTAASYEENQVRPAGNMYVKFNDASWNCEMAIDFFADKSATTLPRGSYSYSTAGTPGTFGPKSYVDIFNPNSSNHMKEGSVINVGLDDYGSYHITMNLLFEDGREANITYEGTISGTPQFESADPEGEQYLTAVAQPYGGGNTTIILYDTADMNDYTKMISLDCYGTATTTFFEPGVYTIGGSEEPFVDTDPMYSFYAVKQEGGSEKTIGFTTGTFTVTLEGEIYTMSLDGVLDDEEATVVKAWYRGKLNTFGPVVTMELTSASYNSNQARPAGNMYVKFNDADWKSEVAIDFFADPSATTLPAGQYTYSTDNTPGTFGPQSVVEIYSPYSNNKMKEGSTIDVNIDDYGVYRMDMNLLFEDGRTGKLTFEGTISGTPVFE